MDLVRPSPDSPPARSLPGMGDPPTGVSMFVITSGSLHALTGDWDRAIGEHLGGCGADPAG